MRLKRLFQLSVFMLCLLLTTAIAFADNPNTDDDAADRDGTYTFTTDGEKYGYESYLIVDNIHTNDPTFVGARLYDVTLKDEGKLICEVDSSDIHHMTIEVCSQNKEEWELTSDSGVKGSYESEALPPGEYTVIFMYTRDESSVLPFEDDIGGKRYFKHYITWKKTPVIKVQSVTVSKATATIQKYEYLNLTASVSPAKAYHRSVTWTSSNPAVAEVSDNGSVRGIEAGTAVITATSTDGVTKGSCTVTVTKTDEEIKEEQEAAERARAAEEEAAAQAAAAAVKTKVANAGKLVVKNVKAKALKGKKAKISWTKKSSVSGYQVQYSTKRSFKKSVTKKATAKGASKRSVTIKKLKAGKTYYVRVRTYTNVKNTAGKTVKVYGKWSKVKKLKAKK